MSPMKQRIFGIALVLLAIGTTVFGYYSTRQLESVTRCQAEYNNDFVLQIKERGKIADEDRENLARMLKTIYTADTREKRAKVLKDYIEVQEANDEKRAKHPLPELSAEAAC